MSKKIQVTFSDEEWSEIQFLNKDFKGLSESAIIRMLSLQRVDELKEKRMDQQPKG